MTDQPPTPSIAQPPTGEEILRQAAEARERDLAQAQILLQEPLRRSTDLGQLALALSQAQGKMTSASRDSRNPYFKSKYASLSSVRDACQDALTTHELAVIQPVTASGRVVIVTTLLVHSSGEWIEGRLALMALQDTPQALGSAITYGRRYALAGMVGVAPEDDDGNQASQDTPAGIKVDRADTPLQRATQPQPSGVSQKAPGSVQKATQSSSTDTISPASASPSPPGMKPPQKAPGSVLGG